jgi:hypothetical protein
MEAFDYWKERHILVHATWNMFSKYEEIWLNNP